MKQKAYLGIDPGKSGAACLLVEDNEMLFFDWPKDDQITQVKLNIELWNNNYEIVSAAIEKVAAMPKQGVSSCFSFGANYGMWRMLLVAMNIPYELVTPQKWQKQFIVKEDGSMPKRRTQNAISRLFPRQQEELRAELYGKRGAYKDGRGDALLLAKYAMQIGCWSATG